jgi:hypothetical protein
MTKDGHFLSSEKGDQYDNDYDGQILGHEPQEALVVITDRVTTR